MKKAFEEARVTLIRLNQDVIVTSSGAQAEEGGSSGTGPSLDGEG